MKRRQKDDVRADIRRLSVELGSPESQMRWGAPMRSALMNAAIGHEQRQARSRERAILHVIR